MCGFFIFHFKLLSKSPHKKNIFQIVFVIVEQVGLSKNDLPLTKKGTPWTSEDLKDVQIVPPPKIISTGEIVFGIIWTVIELVDSYKKARI